jgi:hypothetical protein
MIEQTPVWEAPARSILEDPQVLYVSGIKLKELRGNAREDGCGKFRHWLQNQWE